MNNLRGRIAVVTGASRGIGVYIARALAAEGVHLALSARTIEPVQRLAGELAGAGVQCVAIQADVGTAEGRALVLEQAAAQLGPIDILVNNAALEANLGFTDIPPEEIEELVRVDLVAPMLLTRALLPGMVQRGSGHVVNIASLAGKGATPFDVPYSAAKGGLILFTHSLRAELRGSGVSCSVIVPGFISESGIMADKERKHGIGVPAIVGASPPEAVARAVVRAIKKDVLEIIVGPRPHRLLQAFNQLHPEAYAWILTRIGALDPFKQVAKAITRDVHSTEVTR